MIDARRPFRVRWVVLGLLLIELGWVLAVPPFRGVDEWDHAYRASAVAHGQWMAPPTEATRGTGAFVDAEPDIVEAAQAECQRLEYTGESSASARGSVTTSRSPAAPAGTTHCSTRWSGRRPSSSTEW